ncbi:RNA polymerase sigma factor [Algoriphagus terrigena]|uniref:RNA polymerase sigma factor n=1 Tax=Algoriphagus terrigena TaxID=344884 RepID=UPI000408B4C9|nr:sigma-70 family RNA polymerase sigma factor [Algoriphagus terrigena]
MQAQETHILNECLQDEALLWSQLIEGDKAGLEMIYRRYSHQLFRYGMAIKSNRSFIKDCVHELFVDLWKYRKSLKRTDNVKIYLFKSLSNKIVKEVSRDRRIFLDQEISECQTVGLEESVEEKLIVHQFNERLQQRLKVALEELPVRQREVIQLLFFEKLSYEATSKVLGITVDSSYTLAWKAISRMKKAILVFVFLIALS